MCIITISIYNNLVKLRNRVENAFAQIDVQLTRRYDLIPNLVETVKGYATHEEEVLTAVTEARASVGGARNINEAVEANNSLGSALSRLLVVSEKYPQLQANANFMSLMSDLRTIESQIAVSRQFYNDTCMKYNEKRETFPANIVAKIFKFKEAVYFAATEEQKEAPKVKFD